MMKETTLKIYCQNVWNSTPLGRTALQRDLIFDRDADVCLFQECGPKTIRAGEEALPPMLSVRYDEVPTEAGMLNYTPVFYKRDRFDLIDHGYFLFEGKNDANSKSCNLGVFRNKESGKVFIFATTHLWWRNGNTPTYRWYQAGSDEARAYQLGLANEMIERYRAAYGNCPVVLVGDMNARLGSPALTYALGEGGFTHAHDIATDFRHEGRGYCTCTGEGPAEKWLEGTPADAIDHILVKGMPEGAVKRFDRYTPEYYLLLSDHAPVYIDVAL